jgi:hypothetical protein
VHPLCPLSARQVRVIGNRLVEEATIITKSREPVEEPD